MNDVRAITIQNGFRTRRRPADAWILGAFIFVLSVALTATIPALTMAGRALQIDGPKSSQRAQHTDHRTAVRYRSLVARILEPIPTDGHDGLAAPLASLALSFVDIQESARTFDFAARILERGFSARAPPARLA